MFCTLEILLCATALPYCIVSLDTYYDVSYTFISTGLGIPIIREQKIGFFGRYFAEKSVFGRHREEKSKEKSIRGKIGEKSVKSPIFRRKIKKKTDFSIEKSRLWSTRACAGIFEKISVKYR